MNLKSLPGAALAWVRRTRCGWLVVITLLSLVLRENYPFSHFPMFSGFSSKSYFIYLADAHGTPVQTTRFRLSNSALKKIFDRARREELARFARAGEERVPLADAAAAQSLLRYVAGLTNHFPAAKNLLPGLHVEHVTVRQKDGAIVLEKKTLVPNQ